MSTQPKALLVIAIVIGIFVGVPIGWLSPSGYSEFAAALQAVGILGAAALAVETLKSDRHDKLADRSLSLHRELTGGELGEARRRLALHLRRFGTDREPVRQVLISELRDMPQYATYAPPVSSGSSPFQDANLLVRFFERCRLVQRSGSIDEPIFVELIGRHAAWWNLALLPDHTNARLALHRLADWANDYAVTRHAKYDYLNNWASERRLDFPASFGIDASLPRPRPGF